MVHDPTKETLFPTLPPEILDHLQKLGEVREAAARAISVVREAIGDLRTLSIQYDCRFTVEPRGKIQALRRSLIQYLPGLDPLDSMDRSDREHALSAWLQSHGVERGWKVTAVLVGSGMTRISALAGAMKGYSYMDQSAFQTTDIHKGIESTLKILSSMPKAGVEVVRNYDRGLPHICAYASELNQVRTNPISNALDAMHGKCRLTVRTARADDGERFQIHLSLKHPREQT